MYSMENNNYHRGKIYKLIAKNYTNDSEDNNICYIGSTSKKYLCERLACHKTNYRNYYKGKINNSKYSSSFELFNKFGIDNVKIILLEDYNCNSKYQLETKERYWIENNNNCVNKFIPTRSKKEWLKDNKDYFIKYYKDNKNYFKQYYLNKSKDKIKQKRKEYKEKMLIIKLLIIIYFINVNNINKN